MFLYDNNIVSETYLQVEAEPVDNFFEESMQYNKELLTESMSATKQMLDTVLEYGNTDKVVMEAFADFKDRILKFLREFKAKIITLFRKWIDWIAKKLHMKGLYSDEAVEKLLGDSNKVQALADYELTYSEGIDLGHRFFNELNTPQFPNFVRDSAIDVIARALSNHSGKNIVEIDAQKLRDELMVESNSFVNGNKQYSVTINDIRTLYGYKNSGKTMINNYKNAIIALVNMIERQATQVNGNTRNVMGNQNSYNALITMVTCLNEHLSLMANKYPEYINTIDKIFVDFLPGAEKFLLSRA